MIKVLNLSKSFNGQNILKNIDLDINNGELLVILGGSGAGKSVLLKHLIGLLQPDEGSIMVDGQDITKFRESQLLPLRRKIGYLFQENALYDFMTIFENLAFPLKEHTKMDKAAIAKRVKEILKVVDLKNVEEKYPVELSGGMRKRVGLARSIVLDSKILLCDEPTSGLDPIRSRDISDMIRNVSRDMNCTTVVTSHDLVNSFRIADRIVLIRDGQIEASGTVDEIKFSDNLYVREFIA